MTDEKQDVPFDADFTAGLDPLVYNELLNHGLIEGYAHRQIATLRAERDELREEIERRDQAWLAETRTNEEVVKEMTGQYVPLAIPKHMVSDDQVRTIMDDCEGDQVQPTKGTGDG